MGWLDLFVRNGVVLKSESPNRCLHWGAFVHFRAYNLVAQSQLRLFPTSFTRVDNSKTVRRVKLKSRRENSWAVNDFVPVALLFLWRKSVGTLHKSRSTTKLWKVEIRNSLCFSRLCTKSTSPFVVGWGFCAWRRQDRKKLKKMAKIQCFLVLQGFPSSHRYLANLKH